MIDTKKLLQRVDLVSLAEFAGTKLHRSGPRHAGCCPLHGGDNKTAFTIYDDHEHARWVCFTGCPPTPGHKYADGDAIDFMVRWKNLEIGEAIRELAIFAGVSLDEIGISPEEAARLQEERRHRERRRGLLQVAVDYYHALLMDEVRGAKGRDYAAKRGLTKDSIEKLSLGYSDGRLLAHLQSLGASLDLAEEIGLISRSDKDGHLFDAIPPGYLVYVHSRAGAVEYLTGRATFTDEQDKKSRNLPTARQPFWLVRNYRRPLIIVEGQADAATLWQWEHNAMALCGIAVSEGLAPALARFEAVYLALDSDEEGLKKVETVAGVLGPLTMIVPHLPEKAAGQAEGAAGEEAKGDVDEEAKDAAGEGAKGDADEEAKDAANKSIYYKDFNQWSTDGGATRADLEHLLKKARPWIELAVEAAVAAPAFAQKEHLDRLAGLVVRLPVALQGKYVREICGKHQLAAASDFRALLAAHGGDDAGGNGNGFDVRDGCLNYFGDPLFNGVARITHELTLDDGTVPTVVFTIDGRLNTGEPLEPIEVKAEDFEGMKWMTRHWGARPTLYIPPGRVWQLRWAIQEHSRADLVRERVYMHTGWVMVGGKRVYLTAEGALGADGLDPDVRVDLGQNNMQHYALPAPPPDLRPAVEASLEFLNLGPNFHVTAPLWAAMYAAPLCPFKTLDAVMWVYGTTQTGKSTITHLALTHFGAGFIRGHAYRAPRDWTSSPTDLEGAMFRAKDAVIVIDDYAPAHAGLAEARDLAKKSHYVVRSVGNRSSRGRATANLGERPQRPPRGLVIATAENPLLGASIVGRMIYVPVEYGQILSGDNAALDQAQAHAESGLYAQAMSGYVVWLIRNWDRLAVEVPQRIEKVSREARSLFPTEQSRLTDYYALLVVADRLALEYTASAGALTEEEAGVFAECHRAAIFDVLIQQKERVSGQSPMYKFFMALSDLRSQGKVYLHAKGNADPDRPDVAKVGWYDPQSTTIYLAGELALQQVKAFWRALDEMFDSGTDAIYRELSQAGYIKANENDGRYTRQVWMSSREKTQRVLTLDSQLVYEKTGFVLSDRVTVVEREHGE